MTPHFILAEVMPARRHCRWPIGEPGTPGFGFCGCPIDPKAIYCDPHETLAYQPRSGGRGATRPAKLYSR